MVRKYDLSSDARLLGDHPIGLEELLDELGGRVKSSEGLKDGVLSLASKTSEALLDRTKLVTSDVAERRVDPSRLVRDGRPPRRSCRRCRERCCRPSIQTMA